MRIASGIFPAEPKVPVRTGSSFAATSNNLSRFVDAARRIRNARCISLRENYGETNFSLFHFAPPFD
jgi:hypothetical protein